MPGMNAGGPVPMRAVARQGGVGLDATPAPIKPSTSEAAPPVTGLFRPVPGATTAPLEVSADGVATLGPGLTLGVGKGHRRLAAHLLELAGVPRDPSRCGITLATIPPPPLLDADASDAELVAQVLGAYRGAVEHATGSRCRVLTRKGEVRRWAGFGKLVKAARVLREQEIVPAVWALWSCRQWALRSEPGEVPPLHWVFNVARMVSQRQVFEREAEQFGGRVVWTPALRELMDRHQRMVDMIRRQCATPAEALAAVEACFPDGLHQRLVERARAEAKLEQGALWARVRNGEWVW